MRISSSVNFMRTVLIVLSETGTPDALPAMLRDKVFELG